MNISCMGKLGSRGTVLVHCCCSFLQGLSVGLLSHVVLGGLHMMQLAAIYLANGVPDIKHTATTDSWPASKAVQGNGCSAQPYLLASYQAWLCALCHQDKRGLNSAAAARAGHAALDLDLMLLLPACCCR